MNPDSAIEAANVTAVILAGGRATRMDGNDKGLIELNGEPLVRVIATQLASQVDKLVVNANRNHEKYRQLGFQVVEDDLADFQGPLAGMLSALKQIDTDWLLTLPCDGPYVASDYVKRMYEAVSVGTENLAVASDGDRLQPVYALIHRDLVQSLTRYLASGERKIDRWYTTEGFITVSFTDQLEMFTNLNTPEQLEQATRQPG